MDYHSTTYLHQSEKAHVVSPIEESKESVRNRKGFSEDLAQMTKEAYETTTSISLPRKGKVAF